MSIRSFSMVLTAAFLFGCGGGSGGAITSPPVPPTTPLPSSGSVNSVSVINNAYQPASLTVAAGTAVTWTWNTCSGDSYGGQSCVSHSVTFDDGTTSLTQQTGTFSRTFATKGTYKYHCVVHGTAMSGTVTVS